MSRKPTSKTQTGAVASALATAPQPVLDALGRLQTAFESASGKQDEAVQKRAAADQAEQERGQTAADLETARADVLRLIQETYQLPQPQPPTPGPAPGPGPGPTPSGGDNGAPAHTAASAR